LEKNGNPVEIFDSIVQEEEVEGLRRSRTVSVNNLKRIVNELDEEEKRRKEEEKEKEEEPEERKLLGFYEDEKDIKIRIKKNKPKVVAPEIIFIFDDVSDELNNPYLSFLLKKNRHYRCKVVISSQYPHDLKRDARMMINNWILFAEHPEDKLKIIHEQADLKINFDLFVMMYNIATCQKFNFFYIDTDNQEYRINFNVVFQLKNVS